MPGWPQYTTQAGDLLRDLLDQMGADVTLDRDGLTVEGTGDLYGIDADLADAGELAPTVAALAALADGPRSCAASRTSAVTRPTGSPRSRPRSTRLGGDVTETADGLVVRPRPLRGGLFHTYGDHRLATAGRADRAAGSRRARRGRRDHAKTLPGFTGLWSAMLA